jgi:hypothetical protein
MNEPANAWTVLNTFVANLGGILTAIGVMVVAWFTYKGNLQGKENHQAMNSRMTQLLQATADRAHAQGILDGTKQEQARPGDPKKQIGGQERIDERRDK